ncbi:hypothetical protein AK86_08975 [Streptococcus pneumoniae B1599]|nr:hypothetical protein AK86_08975 [Streptococcus pneumoniae B1599]
MDQTFHKVQSTHGRQMRQVMRHYGSGTWGKVNDDWLGKKTNKVKVYYPQVDGGNPKEDSLAEETEEITLCDETSDSKYYD